MSQADSKQLGAITSDQGLTHLSLGDVRSAYEILDGMVAGVYEDDSIDIMFDLPDKLESLRDILEGILNRHHVHMGGKE